MTSPGLADVTVVTAPSASTEHHSYVDWPAIIAGVVLSSALSILLLTFGSAVGLNFANFNSRPDVNPVWIAIAAASWLLWVMVSATMAGGYITGRLRRRFHDATADESDVRDGAHGILVWAGGLIVAAVLAASGVGALASVVGSTAATLTTAASNVAGGAAEAAAELVDPNAYTIDTLFRAAPTGAAADAAPAAETAAAPAAESATTAATTAPAADATAAPATETAVATPAASLSVAPANDTANDEAVRAEAGRIFAANTVTGEFNADDRAYLAQVVASESGLPQAEAEARVDQAITAVETARDEAAAAAETARKTAVIAAFLIAASLLVSAIGAFWAAQKGGNHRDENVVIDAFRRW